MRRSRIAEAAVVFLALGLVVWALRADDVWFETHFMFHYCAVDPRSLTYAHVARGGAGLAALLLALVVRPRLGRWAEKASFVSVAKRAVPTLVAILLAVVVSDLILRARSRARPRPSQGWLSHTRAESLEAVIAGRKVVYATNADGMRARTPDEPIDYDAPTLVFSGESVAFGFGLEHDDSIPALVGKSTGMKHANMAIPGFANDASLKRIKALLPKFTRPVALVHFVAHTWLERDVMIERQRLGLDMRGNLVEVRPWPQVLSSSPLLATLRSTFRYHSDEAVEVVRMVLQEIAAVARSCGAHPLVVVTEAGAPCITHDGKSPWIARRLVEGLDAQTLEVKVEPEMVLPNDIHPNEAGARHYATAIDRALRDARVVR